jgi:NitT/TauT family transport system substrate-binding protein
MQINRRQIIRAAAAASVGAAVLPGFAQGRTTVKVGYLHTPAVDGHIFIGQQIGSFAKQGLELELSKFTTGLELFQAMIGGSIDMLATGAVLSNFPARGQGKAFLMNDIEYATAQLWVRPDSGIKTIADLKGKQISTTTGTTAHVFLDRALRSAKVDPKDVHVVNQRMTDAVTSFISGAVPAVALWVPFDASIRKQLPNARMLVDASSFFPEAAIVDGWAARNDYYDQKPEVIRKVIAAWADANTLITGKPDEAAEMLQKSHYQDVPLPEFKPQFKASKYYTNAEWRQRYQDGTVTKWLQQVTDFFVKTANIQNPVSAKQYFDPKPFLEVVKA